MSQEERYRKLSEEAARVNTAIAVGLERLESLKRSYDESLEKIRGLGVDPKNAKETLISLRAEIDEKLDSLEKNIASANEVLSKLNLGAN